jgi:protein-S-isoprenylcysteine O-methyltransferase Ste14
MHMRFGAEFESYAVRTPRFLPRLRRASVKNPQQT